MGKTIRYGSDTASMHRASAMAMEKRHGRYSGQIHKDRRAPRGGDRNLAREYLSVLEEDSHPITASPVLRTTDESQE